MGLQVWHKSAVGVFLHLNLVFILLYREFILDVEFLSHCVAFLSHKNFISISSTGYIFLKKRSRDFLIFDYNSCNHTVSTD